MKDIYDEWIHPKLVKESRIPADRSFFSLCASKSILYRYQAQFLAMLKSHRDN
jgi:hypothetical protein